MGHGCHGAGLPPARLHVEDDELRLPHRPLRVPLDAVVDPLERDAQADDDDDLAGISDLTDQGFTL